MSAEKTHHWLILLGYMIAQEDFMTGLENVIIALEDFITDLRDSRHSLMRRAGW